MEIPIPTLSERGLRAICEYAFGSQPKARTQGITGTVTILSDTLLQLKLHAIGRETAILATATMSILIMRRDLMRVSQTDVKGADYRQDIIHPVSLLTGGYKMVAPARLTLQGPHYDERAFAS